MKSTHVAPSVVEASPAVGMSPSERPLQGFRTTDAATRGPSGVARAIAWVWPVIAVVGFVAFVVILIAAGARYPGYSVVSDAIGGLGAKNAPHPDLIGTGFLALSAATVAAGIALIRLLPGRSGTAASILVILAGAAVSSLAFVQQDCSLAKASCVNAGLAGDLSTSHTLHRVVAVLTITALVAALVLMTVSLRGSSDLEPWAEATTWVTLAAGTLFVWFGSQLYGDLGGAVERLVMVLAFGWPVVLSVGLTRRRFASSLLR